MARKTSGSAKPSGPRKQWPGRRESAQRTGGSPNLAVSIRQLKALAKRRQEERVIASWELGKLAAKVLDEANSGGTKRLTTRDLAVQIGLIRAPDPAKGRTPTDDSTLRQMIKFAGRATRDQAQKVQKARVSWRGVVYWLGVSDPKDAQNLYGRMVAGLRDGEEIRRYIDEHCGKKASPRISRTTTEAFAKAQRTAEQLTAVLSEFDEAMSRRPEPASTTDRRELAKRLKMAKRRIDVTLANLYGLAIYAAANRP